MDVYAFDEKFFATYGTLSHIGTPRHSGRYPYGSGEDPNQRHVDFKSQVSSLKKQGLTEKQIADGMGMNTAQLRARTSIATNEIRKADQARALELKETGMSTNAIAKKMGRNESSVRDLLNPSNQQRDAKLQNTVNVLKKKVEQDSYIDVGAGAEHHLGVSRTQLNAALAIAREEGYTFNNHIKVPQLGTSHETTYKILAAPGVTAREIYQNIDNIKGVGAYSEDNGRTFLDILPPVNIDSKRVMVNYGPDGGAAKDGVIELRRNVDDISLGGARYAQVRIGVDGTHYLKGMAMYADDLPDGVDFRFNTNKKDTGNKLDAMKAQKDDPDNPFGATIRQRHYIDKDGNRKLSPLNIVGTRDPDDPDKGKNFAGEEGGWSQWSKALSSQVLSKQTPALAKRQLDITLKQKQDEYDEIMSLTNPAVRKKLLESFANDADSSAVHLKAAALPRQSTHVILPMNSMKTTEVYAPNFHDGEQVALIRYPHGGKFEIPVLTVNNKAAEPNRLIKNAKDAIGIHHKVAEQLSGADFDGDTVLVIPTVGQNLQTHKPLDQLKGFDPQTAYPRYEGMKVMSARTKQIQMGDVSNLITDMTIKGATNAELAKAVKHSMVVIDAEKHKLNYLQSAKDNDISSLKKKYQGSANAGAATLISRASSKAVVNDRKASRVSEGGPINPITGEKNYTYTNAGYTKPGYTRVSAKGKITEVPEKFNPKQFDSTKMYEAKDARELLSKNPAVIETVYADHANALKALGNQARKSYLQTPSVEVNPTSKKVYAAEVTSLKAKLRLAQQNAPLERQAQIIGGAVVKAKIMDTPGMEASEIKKLRGQALQAARDRVLAKKQRIDITPEEWKAIQSGAISNNFLNSILANTDLDRIKEYATPRTSKSPTPTQIALARARVNAGYTQAEVASSLGFSTSTLAKVLQ